MTVPPAVRWCTLPALVAILIALPLTALARHGERIVAGSGSLPHPWSTDPLVPFLDTTVRGGLAVAATCINYEDPMEGGPTGATLDLRSLPAGASVLGAWLYWSVISDRTPVPAGSPTLDGSALTPIPLGEVADSPCFPQGRTGTFRADVTGLVQRNATFVLAGFPGTGTEFGDITEGATLFVLYCDPSAPVADVILWDGIDVVTATATTFSQVLTGFTANAVSPPRAVLSAAIGNGQGRPAPDPDPDPFLFNGVDLDMLDPTLLSGALCPPFGLYDLTVVDVSPWVAAGSTQATVELMTRGDCYSVAALALVVTTDPATAADACLSAGDCRGSVAVPPSVTSCGGAGVAVDLQTAFTSCPLGPRETATRATDPLSASDSTSTSALDPPITATLAVRATLSFTTGGDTDVLNCVEVELIDPLSTSTVIKAAGDPNGSPYDVTALFTGFGQYEVRLTELPGCTAGPTGTAILSAARLVVETDGGAPAAEFRVETAAGTPVSDWDTDPVVVLFPTACPGQESLVARARCTFDLACERATSFELHCSDLAAAFVATASCGESEVCFEDRTQGGIGMRTLAWDFAGEGSSTAAFPCFTFAAPPPWTVEVTATDAAGCTSRTSAVILPPPPPAPPDEPSALDLAPGATPLEVTRVPGGLALSWEGLGPELRHHVHRGVIGTWYSHGDVGACWLAAPGTVLPDEAGDLYFVVVGVACDGTQSSPGRTSSGSDRPTASDLGRDCP